MSPRSHRVISPGRSKELAAILTALGRREGPSVLATLLRTRGSGFRKPGAMALLSPETALAGGVSAGCIEHEVARVGQRVLQRGEPELFRFHSEDRADAIFGFGLVCGGSGEILVEAVDEPLQSRFQELGQRLAQREPVVLARPMDPLPRAPLAWWRGHPPLRGPAPVPTEAHLAAVAEEAGTVWEGESWFLQGFAPLPVLLLVGATAVSASLARLAGEVGFAVFTLDWRADALSRFGHEQSVAIADAGDLAGLPRDRWTSAVILSHQFDRDREMLEALAPLPLAYLGVLGSSTRVRELTRDLPPSHAPLAAPVGLDLGGEGPEEVAVAILAELLLELRRGANAPVRHRRDRP